MQAQHGKYLGMHSDILPRFYGRFSIVIQLMIIVSCIYFSVPNGVFNPPLQPSAPEITTVGLSDFLQLRNMPEVMVIDSRSDQDFTRGHIPGAFHVCSKSNINGSFLSSAQSAPMLLIYDESEAGGQAKNIYNLLMENNVTRIAIYDKGYQEWLSCALPVMKELK